MTGTWTVKSSCLKVGGTSDISFLGLACLTAKITGSIDVTGTLTLGSDGKFSDKTVAKGSDTWGLDPSCLDLSGTKVTCDGISGVFATTLSGYGYETFSCVDDSSTKGCTCQGKINQTGGLGLLYNDGSPTGSYTTSATDKTFSMGDGLKFSYCVANGQLTATPKPSTSDATPYVGTVVLTKGGSGGSGGSGAGGSSGGNGGAAGSGSGGAAAGGSTGKGGTTGGGTSGSSGGTPGSGGSACTGTSCGAPGEGPCDIYKAANMPCAAAYSMVRVLSKGYTGPLFQVRAGSSSNNNTMSGGTTKDIMPGLDGFVDSSTVDAACGSGYCTVSVLYDHSGNNNHLKRAQKGNTAGGATGALDDYESIATKGKVSAGGHTVYSLYMQKTEGYRTTGAGTAMPVGNKPQGTYQFADGTRNASACCWDFGNVTFNPATEWHFMDTLCFGHTFWGLGDGAGPWFGADFEGGVWAGGSKNGDPGWGALSGTHTPNTANPSLKVPFALGFLRVNPTTYAIRVADLATASDLKTAFNGGIPQGISVDHRGGIVLGVGGDNSNNSWGTHYEGAIVAGFPTDDLELSIMKNIQAVGYKAAQ